MVIVDSDVLIDVFRRYAPDKAEQEKIGGTIDEYAVLWTSEDTCDRATELLATHHLGGGIGIMDALIGQLAMDLGLPLHACNRKHYENVSGLDIIVPYQRNASGAAEPERTTGSEP